MGNTSAACGRRTTCRDHPHTHGEHVMTPEAPCMRGGSSPYAWGTLHIEKTESDMTRIIPIRMGNTGRARRGPRSGGDHPHTHGEHGTAAYQPGASYGSSPYAWGTQFFTSHLTMNSPSLASRRVPRHAHPKMNWNLAQDSASGVPRMKSARKARILAVDRLPIQSIDFGCKTTRCKVYAP